MNSVSAPGVILEEQKWAIDEVHNSSWRPSSCAPLDPTWNTVS